MYACLSALVCPQYHYRVLRLTFCVCQHSVSMHLQVTEQGFTLVLLRSGKVTGMNWIYRRGPMLHMEGQINQLLNKSRNLEDFDVANGHQRLWKLETKCSRSSWDDVSGFELLLEGLSQPSTSYMGQVNTSVACRWDKHRYTTIADFAWDCVTR